MVDEVVAKLCVQVIQEPLSYFSEADIQQMLAEELRRGVSPCQQMYTTKVSKGEGSKGLYSTPLLHREYGGGEGTRIDVVLFDPDDVARIDNPNLTIGKRYLQPAFAFELGTEKTIDALTHLQHDLDKVKSAKVAGYIVHIFKDTTATRSGTARREKTEERLKSVFTSVFSESYRELISAAPHDHEKTKAVAILLRTGRQQARMRGKCAIFDGEGFVDVNVARKDSLKAAILKQLL